jgi:hypothetical protein
MNTNNQITCGSKYNKDLRITDITKLVRADIKAAIEAGELPEMKVGVRKHNNSIVVDVKECAALRGNFYNEAQASLTAWGVDFSRAVRIAADGTHMHSGRLSVDATRVNEKIQAILDAYNFDGSDIMSDYFHVNFYTTICFAFSNAEHEALEAKLKAAASGAQQQA